MVIAGGLQGDFTNLHANSVWRTSFLVLEPRRRTMMRAMFLSKFQEREACHDTSRRASGFFFLLFIVLHTMDVSHRAARISI